MENTEKQSYSVSWDGKNSNAKGKDFKKTESKYYIPKKNIKAHSKKAFMCTVEFSTGFKADLWVPRQYTEEVADGFKVAVWIIEAKKSELFQKFMEAHNITHDDFYTINPDFKGAS